MAFVSASSCQFVGIDNIIRAYVRRGVPAWSIWHNKQFMFKYEGKDIGEGEAVLCDHLEALRNSQATYTLCVYEDLPGGKIKSKTENDGSFNFQLKPKDTGENYEGNQLLREIRAAQIEQESRLAALEEGEEGDEVTGIGKAIGMIKEVLTIPGLPEIIAGIFQKPVPAGIGFVPGQQQSSIQQSNENNFMQEPKPQTETLPDVEITERDFERLGAAYAALAPKMPECLELLERLANMAVHNPEKLQGLRSMIKTFVQ